MDSNTFVGNAGVGEREARVICPLVSARHFGLGHGIGRSGDIAEEQPKAAGSSLLYKLTNALCADAIKRAGASDVRECLVLPVATGMTVTLTLLALRKMRPEAKYVVWPRIDQKSCLKAVSAAGCKPLVVENVFEGDELRTDVAGVAARIAEVGAANVLCVLTTTSCFAPRGVDKLLDVARLCAEHGVPHIANNAYGIQCKLCMKAINAASRHGRLDAFIQSTDKNFLVPVGGAVIASSSAAHGKALIAGVSATYPGRASVAPILDLFVTLLHLGASGWERLLQAARGAASVVPRALAAVAHAHGERVLSHAAQLHLACRDALFRRGRAAVHGDGRAALGAADLRRPHHCSDHEDQRGGGHRLPQLRRELRRLPCRARCRLYRRLRPRRPPRPRLTSSSRSSTRRSRSGRR